MCKLYTLIFLSMFSCISWKANAQSGVLKGKLLDHNEAPVSYANVALLRAPDSALHSGVVTNTSGEFIIATPQEGAYVLRFSAIGYKEQKTSPFSVTGPSFSKDFGIIMMAEEVNTLEEVTVSALRPTIIQEADRLVVSVEGTALAAGSTALDVLEKSPGVFIDQNGNVQLNGKAGVTIMLDGRLTYLSANELRSMLEGMSAENIKSIEIITNPSAKYDAEGSSGILNIKLKKNERKGMNGSLYSSYVYNKLHTYAGGGNLNYKSGNWNLFLNLDLSHRPWRRRGTFSRVFSSDQESTFLDQQVREDKIKRTPSIRFGLDYNMNKNQSIGFVTNMIRQVDTSAFLTGTYLGPTPYQPTLFIDANNLTHARFNNYNTNLYYRSKFDTLGTTLTVDFNYVKIKNREKATFNSFYKELNSPDSAYNNLLLSENPYGYDIYTAEIDFTRPFRSAFKIETGAKASRVVSDNDLRFFFDNGETPTLDPNRSNHFIYKEAIYAAYLNLNSQLGKHISVQAGLRAENTHSRGESKTTGQITERKFLNLFPSLFIQQKVNDKYKIAYNYSRRIHRPDYEQLNPFIFYLDPFTWAQGNPNLRPQYTHAFGISQTFMDSYNLILGYQLTQDFLAEVPFQNAERNTTTFIDHNVDNAQYLSATAVIPVKVLKVWDTNNTMVLAYQEFSTILLNEQFTNDQIFYMFQSNHNIQLPFGVRMEMNASYRGPVIWGVERVKEYWWVNLGLKKSLLKDKLDFSISANDIFRTRLIVGGANIGRNINLFDQYFFSRSIGLTLRYHFSKGERFDAKRPDNMLEEINRTGN